MAAFLTIDPQLVFRSLAFFGLYCYVWRYSGIGIYQITQNVRKS
jgi:hypothetical protein